MARNFGQRPSEMFGILDRGIALDFDRLHSLRLLLFDVEIAKKQAEAMKGEAEPAMPSLFKSNETGSFEPTAEELRDGYRYNGEIVS